MNNIPKELLTFDIEDICKESSYETHSSLSRRLTTRIIGISNIIYMNRNIIDYEIYTGHIGMEYIIDSSNFHISDPTYSNYLGVMSGIIIFKDDNLTDTLEFRDRNMNVLAKLDFRNRRKLREEKLKDILNI